MEAGDGRDVCTPMHTAAAFTLAQLWRKPKCLHTERANSGLAGGFLPSASQREGACALLWEYPGSFLSPVSLMIIPCASFASPETSLYLSPGLIPGSVMMGVWAVLLLPLPPS